MVAVTSVFIVVLISLIATRVATVTLIVTGLSRGTARFQARSALSSVGFTTSEAEAMLSHPVRRRVVMFLMLFGSAGIVTLVASLIISFTTTTDGRDAFLRSLTLVAGLSVVLLVARNPWIDQEANADHRRLALALHEHRCTRLRRVAQPDRRLHRGRARPPTGLARRVRRRPDR